MSHESPDDFEINWAELSWAEQLRLRHANDFEDAQARAAHWNEVARLATEIAEQKRREEANPSFFKKLQKLFA